MSVQDYRELILDGIKGLPDRALAEIADFIWVMRQRELDEGENDAFHQFSFGVERSRLSMQNEAHLEEEFAGYDSRYPQQ